MVCEPPRPQVGQAPHPKSKRSRRRNNKRWQQRRVQRALRRIEKDRKWHETLWERYVRRFRRAIERSSPGMTADIRYFEAYVSRIRFADYTMEEFRNFLWFFGLSEWERFDFCRQAREGRRRDIVTRHPRRAA